MRGESTCDEPYGWTTVFPYICLFTQGNTLKIFLSMADISVINGAISLWMRDGEGDGCVYDPSCFFSVRYGLQPYTNRTVQKGSRLQNGVRD